MAEAGGAMGILERLSKKLIAHGLSVAVIATAKRAYSRNFTYMAKNWSRWQSQTATSTLFASSSFASFQTTLLGAKFCEVGRLRIQGTQRTDRI
ncbi:hypothetical protein IFM89_039431 [Coptis chinensis]|uniref:Uncharacterized protein n=1 Tax=Coptis chinensis TaxID=261450 RepID=A0A835IJ41_9MAGN|nr:hypothetical protein IFM89_039431 [Coptis chinensis]